MPFQAIQFVTTGFGLVAFLGALVLLGFRAWLRAKAAEINTAPEDKKLEIISVINEYVPVDLPALSPNTRDQVAILQVKMRGRRDLIHALLLFGFAVIAGIVTVIVSKPVVDKNPSSSATDSNDKSPEFAENPEFRVNSFYYNATDPDYVGPQYWRRVTPDTFAETKTQDATEKQAFFNVVKRINYAGCDGIVVEKKYSPSLQLFIPEKKLSIHGVEVQTCARERVDQSQNDGGHKVIFGKIDCI